MLPLFAWGCQTLSPYPISDSGLLSLICSLHRLYLYSLLSYTYCKHIILCICDYSSPLYRIQNMFKKYMLLLLFCLYPIFSSFVFHHIKQSTKWYFVQFLVLLMSYIHISYSVTHSTYYYFAYSVLPRQFYYIPLYTLKLYVCSLLQSSSL